MITSLQRVAITSGVCALAIVLLGATELSLPLGDDFATPGGKSVAPIVGILEGVSVTQQFPAAGDSIDGISLQLATYHPQSKGSIEITLSKKVGKQWQKLVSRKWLKKDLLDNGAHRMILKPALKVKRGEAIAITLEADLDATQALTWWKNPGWQQAKYELLVNGVPQTGTGIFSVAYTRASGRVMSSLPAFWKRVGIFLNPFWRGVLLSAVLLTLFAFVHLTLWGPASRPSATES